MSHGEPSPAAATVAADATTADLLDRAREWRDDDPDPRTRDELGSLIERGQVGDAAALADLADRFVGLLQFGTAGLRGALGAGPNRMNSAVVIRAGVGSLIGQHLLKGHFKQRHIPSSKRFAKMIWQGEGNVRNSRCIGDTPGTFCLSGASKYRIL